MISFEDAMQILDKFTARPKDGDYDAHVHAAMAAMYALLTYYEEDTSVESTD